MAQAAFPVTAIGFPQAEAGGLDDDRNYDLVCFAQNKASAFLGFVRLPDARGYRSRQEDISSTDEFLKKHPEMVGHHPQVFVTRLRISGGVEMYHPCFAEAWMEFFNAARTLMGSKEHENVISCELKGTSGGKEAVLKPWYHTIAIEPFATLSVIDGKDPCKASIEIPVDAKNRLLFENLGKGFDDELAGKRDLTSRKKGTRRALRLDWNKIDVWALDEGQIRRSCCDAAEFESRTGIFKKQGALLEI